MLESAKDTTEVGSEGKRPIQLIVMGMAGSGKTSMMMRLNAFVASQRKKGYVINLDPAVTSLPFKPNIDIQDMVDYKQVMKDFRLGPNGAIMTSLNLFTTKFEQVLDLIDERSNEIDYFIVDTPGQIEIFTWSASGSIITETMANNGNSTVLLYIIDTPKCTNPTTFMSNMLYACSIMYKAKLPFIIIFNKTDLVDPQFAFDWMQDYEVFQEALTKKINFDSHGARDEDGDGDVGYCDQEDSYMNSLNQSLALVLDEFYQHIKAVGVSAVTGEGCEDLFQAIEEADQEYRQEYLPILQMKQREKVQEEHKKTLEAETNQEKAEKDIQRLLNDLALEEESVTGNAVAK